LSTLSLWTCNFLNLLRARAKVSSEDGRPVNEQFVQLTTEGVDIHE
jgi:hypothetical protein